VCVCVRACVDVRICAYYMNIHCEYNYCDGGSHDLYMIIVHSKSGEV
jgi:hypothetical protein